MLASAYVVEVAPPLALLTAERSLAESFCTECVLNSEHMLASAYVVEVVKCLCSEAFYLQKNAPISAAFFPTETNCKDNWLVSPYILALNYVVE